MQVSRLRPGLACRYRKQLTRDGQSITGRQDHRSFERRGSSVHFGWPDEIRRRGNPYDHPKWHYVDYPLKPPKFPVEPGPDPTDDILYGIAQCEKTSQTPKRLRKNVRNIALENAYVHGELKD